MPLTRDNVTAASRVMLPTYVLFFAAVGANYVTDAPRLQQSPSLHYANTLLPLQAWGGFFLCCAAIMAAALLSHRRTAYRFALWLCIVSMGVWSGVFALAAINSIASFTAPAWPAIVAVACYATDRSLLKGEVQ